VPPPPPVPPEERIKLAVNQMQFDKLSRRMRESITDGLIASFKRYAEIVPEHALAAQDETIRVAGEMLRYLDSIITQTIVEGPFNASSVDSINNFGYVLSQFLQPLFKVKTPGLFADIKRRYDENTRATSSQILTRDELVDGKLINPEEHSGTNREIVRAYLTGTPFARIFNE
jgi:hypothetical protein